MGRRYLAHRRQVKAAISRPIQIPSGHWRIRWLSAAGNRQSATFSAYNDARAALARHQVQAEAIRTGAIEAPPARKTFEDLCAAWLIHKGEKRSVKDMESRIRVHLQPAFGGLALAQITDDAIETFSHGLTEKMVPQTKKHVLLQLQGLLKYAVRKGWLHRVPPIDMPKINPLPGVN